MKASREKQLLAPKAPTVGRGKGVSLDSECDFPKKGYANSKGDGEASSKSEIKGYDKMLRSMVGDRPGDLVKLVSNDGRSTKVVVSLEPGLVDVSLILL